VIPWRKCWEKALQHGFGRNRHAYGLDLPLWQQYINYWKGVLRGDLGASLRYNQSVSKLLRQRYPTRYN